MFAMHTCTDQLGSAQRAVEAASGEYNESYFIFERMLLELFAHSIVCNPMNSINIAKGTIMIGIVQTNQTNVKT